MACTSPTCSSPNSPTSSCTSNQGEPDGTTRCDNEKSACSGCKSKAACCVATQLACCSESYLKEICSCMECQAQTELTFAQWMSIFSFDVQIKKIVQITLESAKSIKATVESIRSGTLIPKFQGDMASLGETFATDDLSHATIKTMNANIQHCSTSILDEICNVISVVSQIIDTVASITSTKQDQNFDLEHLTFAAQCLADDTNIHMCFIEHKQCKLNECTANLAAAAERISSCQADKVACKQLAIDAKKIFDKGCSGVNSGCNGNPAISNNSSSYSNLTKTIDIPDIVKQTSINELTSLVSSENIQESVETIIEKIDPTGKVSSSLLATNDLTTTLTNAGIDYLGNDILQGLV